MRPSASANASASKANVFVFTSWIARTSSGTSSGYLVSTMRSKSPSASRTTRPSDSASSRSTLTTVAAAPESRCALNTSSRASAVTRGWSPFITMTVSESWITPSAARTAPPVPSEWVCTAVSVPSGSADETSRAGETITHTRSALASRAASTGQATIGRPQTGWSIFGTDERIRVPSPAAMISTVGPLTCGIVERRGTTYASGSASWEPFASSLSICRRSASRSYQRTHFRIALSETPYFRPTAR